MGCSLFLQGYKLCKLLYQSIIIIVLLNPKNPKRSKSDSVKSRISISAEQMFKYNEILRYTQDDIVDNNNTPSDEFTINLQLSFSIDYRLTPADYLPPGLI